MADLRPQFSEEAVGANHPTKTDVINRAYNVEHDEDGTHGDITGDSIIKGWIQFDGTGVIAIQGSFNVASIDDEGVGLYQVNWDTNFANIDYSCVWGGESFELRMLNYAVGAIDLSCLDEAANPRDSSNVNLIAIGDQ